MTTSTLERADEMAWMWLMLASVCEIAWALLLKASDGGKERALFVASVIFMLASFGLLSQAMKGLPVGTAYAAWTGIGAVGAALFGAVWFHESLSWPRWVFLALTIIGIAGLSLWPAESTAQTADGDESANARARADGAPTA